MPKQKRDYSALKLEFFQSDFDEIKSFLNNKGITGINGMRVKGWSAEKVDYKNKILEKVLEKNATKESNELLVPISFLMKAKKNTLIKLAKKLSEEDLSVGDMTKGLESIKTELGEPSKITQNQNLNKEITEDLTDEEKSALETILKGK